VSTTNRTGNDEAPPNGENGRRIRLAFARPPRAVRAAARWAGASFLHARVTPESSARQASAARAGLLLLALGLAAIPSAALNAPGFAAVTLSACGFGLLLASIISKDILPARARCAACGIFEPGRRQMAARAWNGGRRREANNCPKR